MGEGTPTLSTILLMRTEGERNVSTSVTNMVLGSFNEQKVKKTTFVLTGVLMSSHKYEQSIKIGNHGRL